MSNLDTLSANRVANIKAAAEGCWDGTDELIGALVRESRNVGSWKPGRVAMLTMLAGPGQKHMTAEEFRIWKKQARATAKILGLTQKPADDLGIPKRRYEELSSEARHKSKGLVISRAEALGCAHYLMGLEKPCQPDELAEWFFARFGSFASVEPLFDWDVRHISNRINGYTVVNNVRQTVVPEGFFIRALDWIWRFGNLNPYGDRPTVSLWPDQKELPR